MVRVHTQLHTTARSMFLGRPLRNRDVKKLTHQNGVKASVAEHRGKTSAHAPNYENIALNLKILS